MLIRLLPLTVLLFALPAHAEVTLAWVTVGGPGNACDPLESECFGSVAETFRIAEFETTNAQYAELLNAVAATDTNALYNTSMGSGLGGITRSGSSGSFTYSAIAGRENMPVNFVSFWDATRFANWLTNDEWYKAAYYDVGAMIYFDYATGTDTESVCSTPGAVANTANCQQAIGDVAEVGSYTNTQSPSGTSDQCGNLHEWNETAFGVRRGLRGGSYAHHPFTCSVGGLGQFLPDNENSAKGIRLAASVPPQAVPALSPVGMLVVAAGLLGASTGLRQRS